MTAETNAERLEGIVNGCLVDALEQHLDTWLSGKEEIIEDVSWLIQQAVRARELEQEKEFFRRSFVELKAGDVITRKENTRLREGLKSLSEEVGRHGAYGGFMSKAISANIQWDIDEILQQEDSK